MNKTITLDGKEYQIDAELLMKLINKEEIDSDVVEEVKLTGWERVEKNKEYYILDDDSGSSRSLEENDSVDNQRYNIGNYFSTESKAQEMADKIKLLLAMTKFRDENDRDYCGQTDGWCVFVDKYAYNDGSALIKAIWVNVASIFEITFTTHKLAEQCLELFEDDIKKVWGIE